MNVNSYYLSINELSKLIREQQVSPVEIVNSCLERINTLNPRLNAFITVLGDQAREQAKLAEVEIKSGKWRGPLHGIPVGIKDFYDTAGIRTTAAFKYFKDRIPAKDAVAVTKLKDAGAIIIGKMNMHQLGMGTTGLVSHYGPAKNPWNSDYIPGGSSSGSAVAVSSGMCFATLDTDAVGSCRLPASVCGVTGFKGTYGLLNGEGILAGEKADEMILWLSHPAITTRNIEDTALVLNVLAERNENTKNVDFFDGLAVNTELRIGVAENVKAGQEVLATFEKAVEAIRALGHNTINTLAPFGDPSKGIKNIEADRKSIAEQSFKNIDVLLLPTCTTTVPLIKNAKSNEQTLSPENTAFANYYGLPAVSIPCGFDAKGLPLGLQIVGKPWDEITVLRLAYQYQMTNEYGKRHPIA
ncbi:MAG: amidase [Anaerolineales bacterium]|nr:amidase [Anaerolineales bacterium]